MSSHGFGSRNKLAIVKKRSTTWKKDIHESYMLPRMVYSAFANSCPLQTDTFLFPFIHSHNVILSSNKF